MDKKNKWMLYAFYGFLLGLIFPLVGTLHLLFSSGMEISFRLIIEMHAEQPLLWIIDFAPLIMSILLILIGKQYEISQETSAQLKKQIADQASLIQDEHYFFQALIDNSPLAVVQLDSDHRVVASNPVFKELFGYSDNEIIGGDLDKLVATKDLYDEATEISKSTIAGNISRKVSQRKKKDGSLFDVEIFSIPVSVGGETIGALGLYHDISERIKTERALHESEARYRSVAQVASDAIIIINSDGKIMTWNNGAQNIFGYSADEMLGKDLDNLMPKSFYGKHKEGLSRVNTGGKRNVIGKTVKLEGVRKGGSVFPLELSLSTWETRDGMFYGGIIRDISERKEAEEKLRFISFHDALTGLYNRGYFDEEMTRLGESRQFPISIIVCDMDDLKQVNDTFGHNVGDKALKGIAHILTTVFRSEDVIARMGGDEFAVMAPHYDISENPSISMRLDKAIIDYNESKNDDGFHRPISLSFGFSVVHQGESLEKGYKRADELMYSKKAQKKSKKK